ncbi:unnamed protein product [Arctogadus glacialis]
MEATGLLKAINQPSFLFIACMTHQILSLLDPPNTALQAKSTDLYTGVRLVQSALACVEKLRCDTQFDTFWEKFSQDRQTTEPPAAAPPQKRPRNLSHLSDYVVDTTVGHRQKEAEERTGCKRLYFSTLDAVVGEIKARFSVRNSQLVQALCTLHPGSEDFLNANKKPDKWLKKPDKEQLEASSASWEGKGGLNCTAVVLGDPDSLKTAQWLAQNRNYRRKVKLTDEYYINATQDCRVYRSRAGREI